MALVQWMRVGSPGWQEGSGKQARLDTAPFTACFFTVLPPGFGFVRCPPASSVRPRLDGMSGVSFSDVVFIVANLREYSTYVLYLNLL